MRNNGFTDLCFTDCPELMPVEKTYEGNTGNTFSPEYYTGHYTGYICIKHRKELDLVWTLGSFSLPDENFTPYKCEECLSKIENITSFKDLSWGEKQKVMYGVGGLSESDEDSEIFIPKGVEIKIMEKVKSFSNYDKENNHD